MTLVLLALLMAAICVQGTVCLGFAQQLTQKMNADILAPLAYFSVSALGSVVCEATFVKGVYFRLLPGGLLVVVLLVVVLLVVALLVVALLVVVFMVVVVVEVLLVVVL